MPKIELSIKEKICLAGLTVLGKDYLAEAFDMCHNVKTTNQGSLSVMRSKWLNNDRVKEFTAGIRKQYADTLLDNIGEDTELTDKQLIAIIQRGIISEKDMKKQSDMSLKLMQWRKDAKEEESETKDNRTYFIPWVSHCRTCALMKVFQKAQEEKEKENSK